MAQGKFGGGTGLISDPYLIEDIADLNQIRVNPSLHYKLKYSINAGVAPYNEGNGWDPIANFTGSLNGNGKKIFNLFINRPNEDNVGLFRYIRGTNYPSQMPWSDISLKATSYRDIDIYDLGLENVNITGRNYVGGLVGLFNVHGVSSGTSLTLDLDFIFKRIFVTGTVKGSSSVGGLLGGIYTQTHYHSAYTGWEHSTYYYTNFMRDIYTNVSIVASNANTNYGGVVGRILRTDATGYRGYLLYNRITSLGTNVVSNSTFNSTINGLIAHPIFGDNDSMVIGNCINFFFNSDNWSTNPNRLSTALTTEQMKRSTSLGSIVEQVNDFDASQRTWTFERGRYPQLYFAIANNLFIKTSDGFYSLDKDNKLVKKFDMTPSREEAIEHGFKDISKISNNIWMELRSKYSSVDIINIVERASHVTNNITTHELDADVNNSTETNLVYRKTFDFADFNDGIATIRTV